MSGLRIAQVCADRGIAPGGTKGASLHLRGIAAGLTSIGASVTTYSQRSCEADFPTRVCALGDLPNAIDLDVIYERYSLGHVEGLAEARRRGIPFVLEVNAPLVDEATQHRPATVDPTDRAIEEHLVREADLVVVVSTELQRWVSARRGRPTIMLTNGFEPAWFDGPGPEKTVDIAFIGHPKPWHGADRIAPLLATLAEQGLAADAIIIGGGKAADPLRDQAEALGVADRLEITGALAPVEAAKRLRLARVGVAPYRTIDPFYFCPLKIVDYLAAGLAVVGSALGDIPSLVGSSGLVVNPDSDDELASAVAKLLTAPARCDEMASKGRERAFGQHTWTEVASRTLVAIDELRPVMSSLSTG